MPIERRGGESPPSKHQDEYSEFTGGSNVSTNARYDAFADNATILSRSITITETCVVVVVGTMLTTESVAITDMELEQPKGTIVVDHEDKTTTYNIGVFHYVSWRVLTPGVYTFELVNRAGNSLNMYSAQLEVVAVM